MKWISTLLLALAVAVPSIAQSANKTAAYRSMERKLDAIARNGAAPRAQPVYTEITADEANAWINQGGVKLPAGVSDVRLSSTPGIITADSRIDFDKLTAGVNSSNPLLSLFTGIHDVNVVAHASAAGGLAQVHVQSMSIDGVTVPRMAMEFFVNKYLKPKYPNVGLDTTFQLPARIDQAAVGANKVTLKQK
jgi:hypothetical protein